jgi:hypothetical protein
MRAFQKCRFCRGLGCLACDGERERHRQEVVQRLTTPFPDKDESFGMLADVALTLWLQREFNLTEQQAAWFKQFLPLPELPAQVKEDMLHGDVVLSTFADCIRLIGESGQPIYPAHFDNPGEMLVLKQVFGRDAIEAAVQEHGEAWQHAVVHRLVEQTMGGLCW